MKNLSKLISPKFIIIYANLFFLLTVPASSFANASGSGIVTEIGGMTESPSGTPPSLYFGITPPPTQRASCSTLPQYQFVFDPTTPQGKTLYAAILMARALGKQINVYGTGTCEYGQPMEGVFYWSVDP